jgi:hypothetical protein
VMEVLYAAYGLLLRSSFEVPGMTPTGPLRLPSLAIELVSPADLERTWSGREGEPIWRGQLGDGNYLTIERGRAGDLLYAHGDFARHRLDPTMQSLSCAPLRSGLEWQRTLATKVISTVSMLRGYEALHASGVDSPLGAVAIVAPTGMGKTTLALEMMGRGWPLLSDDILTLAKAPGGVLAYPGTPHLNVAGSAEDPSVRGMGHTLAVLAGERWVAAASLGLEARPVRAVCLLERRRGLALAAELLPPSPLLLAPYMLGLSENVERERRRFEVYADLIDGARLVSLTAGLHHPPAELGDLLENVLTGESLIATGTLA